MKPGRYPAWLVKTGLIVSVLPFVGCGAFLIGRILRTNRDNYKLVLPFISFVLLFCAIPVVYVFLRLRRMQTPASPASGTIFVIAGITLFVAVLLWGWLYMTVK